MCQFIIRPVDCYATVDYLSDKTSIELEAGQKVKVKHVSVDTVTVIAENVAKEKYEVNIPIATFVHMFSLKDPNAKEDKKK